MPDTSGDVCAVFFKGKIPPRRQSCLCELSAHQHSQTRIVCATRPDARVLSSVVRHDGMTCRPCHAGAPARNAMMTCSQPAHRVFSGKAATDLMCCPVGTGQFSPIGRHKSFFTGETSHEVLTSLSTSLLKLPKYSSSLCVRLGGSKIERIFRVTSVSF